MKKFFEVIGIILVFALVAFVWFISILLGATPPSKDSF